MLALETFLRSLLTIHECSEHQTLLQEARIRIKVSESQDGLLRIVIRPVGYEHSRWWVGIVRGDKVTPDLTYHGDTLAH